MAELDSTMMNINDTKERSKEITANLNKKKEKDKIEKKSKKDRIYKKIGFWLLLISIIVFIAVFLFMWLC